MLRLRTRSDGPDASRHRAILDERCRAVGEHARPHRQMALHRQHGRRQRFAHRDLQQTGDSLTGHYSSQTLGETDFKGRVTAPKVVSSIQRGPAGHARQRHLFRDARYQRHDEGHGLDFRRHGRWDIHREATVGLLTTNQNEMSDRTHRVCPVALASTSCYLSRTYVTISGMSVHCLGAANRLSPTVATSPDAGEAGTEDAAGRVSVGRLRLKDGDSRAAGASNADTGAEPEP